MTGFSEGGGEGGGEGGREGDDESQAVTLAILHTRSRISQLAL